MLSFDGRFNMSEVNQPPEHESRLQHHQDQTMVGAPRPFRPKSVLVGYVLMPLAAAAALWLAVQASYPFFVAPRGPAQSGNPAPPSPEQVALLARARLENAVTLFALCAAAVASILALAAAVARRAWGAAVAGVCGGLLIAGCCGAAAGWAALRVFESALPKHLGDTFGMAVVYSVGWGVSGLGVGIVASLPATRLRLIGLSGVAVLLAGVAAAFAYPLFEALAGIVWPASTSADILPEGGLNRFLWFATPSVFMGVAAALAYPRAATTTQPI